jgi:hypothetical protein
MYMNNVNFTAGVEESTTLEKLVPLGDSGVTLVEENNKYAHGAMELPKDYILDYKEYRNVLEACNSSINKTPFPSDGT